MLNATRYFTAYGLLLVNVSSYNDTADSYDPTAQTMSLLPSPDCAFGKYSFASAIPYTRAVLVKMLCDGVAGMGLNGQTLTAGRSWPGASSFGYCDQSGLPPKSSIGKFKASKTAKAACAKIKDVLANVMWDTMGTEAGKASNNALTPALAPLDCTVSWKADLNFFDKVGGLGVANGQPKHSRAAGATVRHAASAHARPGMPACATLGNG